MKQILKIPWDEFDKIAKEIAQTIKESGKKYDYITGFPRGGVCLAIYLSHLLDIGYCEYAEAIRYKTNLHYLSDDEYNKAITSQIKKDKVLVCDDIVDSGRTLRLIMDDFKNDNLQVATLGRKESSPYVPYTIVGRVWPDDKWINLPWEKEDEEQNR